jgi:hypothetical protein
MRAFAGVQPLRGVVGPLAQLTLLVVAGTRKASVLQLLVPHASASPPAFLDQVANLKNIAKCTI